MPPEVALRRKETGRRRGLIAVMVLVVSLVAGGVAAAFWYAGQAEARLAAERQVTDELLTTQLQYAEVIQVRSQLDSIKGVRDRLGATEVLWRDVVTQYLAVLNAEEILEAASITGIDPNGPALGLADPLRSPRAATIIMTVATVDLPTPHQWLRSWKLLDTFADASIDSILEEDGWYLSTVTINLDSTALSGRTSESEVEQ
ncbi:MAG: hypothetical protein KIT89_11370 [Microcella sp.]|uniref:hypothetical protein n=1 Tax=Microcella sp. TaxID=1913979 RepID=UPI0024CDAD12|nr:hypothetical protein [Microcella sp.]UYN83284.1 MAG: hypothetical protein KIT89_11370 [Microcella sp.]